MSDGQEALEEKSAELAEEANADATAKTEKKPNFFYRLARGIIPWKGDNAGDGGARCSGCGRARGRAY